MSRLGWAQGGYSESYAPFCGLAVVEELSGATRSPVSKPFLADRERPERRQTRENRSARTRKHTPPSPCPITSVLHSRSNPIGVRALALLGSLKILGAIEGRDRERHAIACFTACTCETG